MTPPSGPLRSRDTALVTDGGDSGDRGRERHRILRELRRELERHPAMLGVDAESATLQATWWPASADPEYAFHYSDDTEFDCGWHREPNPHVEGKLHYQERSLADEPYRYESVLFPAGTPPRVLWTVLDRLADRLG
jgi:hypothetical protein